MAMQTNLEALIEAAKHLSGEERRKLAETLLADPHSNGPRHITELRGLGKDLWEKVDPQDYLNSERNSWGD